MPKLPDPDKITQDLQEMLSYVMENQETVPQNVIKTCILAALFLAALLDECSPSQLIWCIERVDRGLKEWRDRHEKGDDTPPTIH